MNENLKVFMKYVSEHEEVASKFGALKEEQDKQKVIDATIAIAKECGFELTADDFAHEELSEKELAAVAGGGEICACVLGGGGKEGDGGRTCGCVFYGEGLDDNNEIRCVCPLAGGGN